MTFPNMRGEGENTNPFTEATSSATVAMIDIHTHVLPGFDDGATSLAESIEMVNLAETDGIGAIFATPHSAFLVGKNYGKAEIEKAVSDLQRESRRQHSQVKVLPGIEVHLSPEIVQDIDAGKAFPLNDSHYLLLELPFVSYPLNTEQVIVTLRQVRGLVPIIAHPERLDYFQQDPDALRKLVELGALIQLTAGSLTGRFGSRSLQTSQIMLAHGWVHFLASDAHDNTYRTPNLSAALEAAVEMIGMEAAQALVAGNPQAVLDDREIESEQPLRYEPKHRRWFFR